MTPGEVKSLRFFKMKTGAGGRVNFRDITQGDSHEATAHGQSKGLDRVLSPLCLLFRRFILHFQRLNSLRADKSAVQKVMRAMLIITDFRRQANRHAGRIITAA